MISTMSEPAIRGEGTGGVVDGRFPLLQWLGGSARADVFLTELSDRGRKAIIKLIPADAEDAESRLAAWEAAAALSHPNLMQVHAFGRCEVESVQALYVVTELAEEVLADILVERPLSVREAGEMLHPALDALAYLHRKGLVHGRLKPSNIMGAGDRLKLSTDGIVFAGDTGRLVQEPSVYDAPETADSPIGPEADVWAFGATIVAVLPQRPQSWDLLAPTEAFVPEGMPEPFASIARECLAIDPADRCSLDRIGRWLEKGAVSSSSAGKTAGAPRVRRLAELAFLVAGLAIAGFGLWNLFFQTEQPAPPAAKVESAPANPVSAPSHAAAPKVASAPVSKAAPPAPVRTPAPVAVQPAPQTAAVPASGGATRRGAIVQQVQPNVNSAALATISGALHVSIRLAVDEHGAVTDASLQSPGPSQYFANKALEAARRWRFQPALNNGRAVASNWTLQFAFRQSGIDITPSETAP